ncbi:hypothetical protein [Maridesulfovibrio sp. FT414]|uniref:hypothetical protein n=1 Tax=Maridesulfovibrio sp. FT414 TaxID=2979469 RepID=UPI003D8063F8
MSFEMVPYVEWDGVRSFPDSYIRTLFERMVVERKADTVLYDEQTHDPDKFVQLLKNSVSWLVVQDEIVVGLVWLNHHEGRFARMHWVVFEACPRRQVFEMGRFVNRNILNMKDKDGGYVYDMLLGFVPIRNGVAIKYVEKCGGKICGEIPYGAWIACRGRSEPVALICLTRELLNESLH